jgi:hypothetical protein
MKDNPYFKELSVRQHEAMTALRDAFGIEALAENVRPDIVIAEHEALDETLAHLLFVETVRSLALLSLPCLAFLIATWLGGPWSLCLLMPVCGLSLMGVKRFQKLRLKERLFGIWKWPTKNGPQSPEPLRRLGLQFFPATA